MIRSLYPTTEQLMAQQRSQRRLVLTAFTLMLLLVSATMGVVVFLSPAINPGIAFALAVIEIVAVVIPVVIWNHPRAGLYILMVAAMMFGCGTPRTERATIPTQFISFWWNISIIGQEHNTAALNALVFSVAEVVMVLTGASWLIRGIVKRDLKTQVGAFFWPIMAYIAFVGWGLVRGMTTGGDRIIALNEIRCQVHFLYAYLLAVNMFQDRRQVTPLVWIIAICVGIQGIFGTITYLVAPPTDDTVGIMGHDDSLLFNLLFFVCFLAWLTRIDKRLMAVSTLLVPFALTASMVNGRRASIAAFLVALLPLVPVAFVVLRSRRAAVARFAVGFALVSAIYLPIAWHGSGPWALPARAIRSASDPNSRDSASNAYRDMENADLKMTRNAQPWLGYGYGKEFYQFIALPQVTTDLLHYMPHNGVLWVWMRLGNFGFFAFIMIFITVCVRGPQILKETRDPWLKILGMLAIAHMLMLFTYGKYDLQFSNDRQMVAAAILIGVLGNMKRLDAASREIQDEAAEAARLEAREVALSHS